METGSEESKLEWKQRARLGGWTPVPAERWRRTPGRHGSGEKALTRRHVPGPELGARASGLGVATLDEDGG